MNLVFLYVYPFNPLKGGVERVTDIIAKELKAMGHSIRFLIYRKDSNPYTYAAPTDYFPSSDFVSKENIDFYKKYIRLHKIDICILQNPVFYKNIYKLFPLDNCKLISVIHTDPSRGLRHFRYSYLRKRTSLQDYISKYIPRLIASIYYKRQLKKEAYESVSNSLSASDAVVFLSDKFTSDLVYIGINPDNSKIKYIGNPVSYPKYTSLSDKKNYIIFVGRMNANKQPDFIIRVWNKIAPDYPDWKLIMVGDGDIFDYCKSLTKYPEQTVFTGYTNPESLYEESKILCMASVYEGFPMTLIEAMCKSVVPVTFDSFASVRQIIDNNKNGVLIRPFSQKEYESKLRRLIDDEMYRNELAKNAIIKTADFKPSIIAEQWEALFRSIYKK